MSGKILLDSLGRRLLDNSSHSVLDTGGPCVCCGEAPCTSGYRQAYDCADDTPQGKWLAVADILANIAVIGTLSGSDRQCLYFADCVVSVPGGDSLLTGIRGWFPSCAPCHCGACYTSTPSGTTPNKLTLTVVQSSYNCCQDSDDDGFGNLIGRRRITGSGSGTWDIPLTGSIPFNGAYSADNYGEITTTGPTIERRAPDPVTGWTNPSAPALGLGLCDTGFKEKDDRCCDDGVFVSSGSDMLIRVWIGARDLFGSGYGPSGSDCWVEAISLYDGCIIWQFIMPGCPDDPSSIDDLDWTGTQDTAISCATVTDCFGLQGATAAGSFTWPV